MFKFAPLFCIALFAGLQAAHILEPVPGFIALLTSVFIYFVFNPPAMFKNKTYNALLWAEIATGIGFVAICTLLVFTQIDVKQTYLVIIPLGILLWMLRWREKKNLHP